VKSFLFREKIEGKKVILKKHNLSLATNMFSYVDQDRERLEKFLPWVFMTNSVKDEEDYILSTHKKWDEMSLFDYGLFRKEDDLYMGNLGVHTINWESNSCELGYWILGEFEGNGYMSDAVLTLEQYLFQQGFNRIQIRCSSINERSSNIPKRNQYQLDGVLREDAVELGEYRDTKIFSKTAGDYLKQTNSILIRNARGLKDIGGIANVHVQSWQETYSGIIPETYLEQRTVEKSQAMWSDILTRGEDPCRFTFVAIDQQGQIVGFINGGAAREIEHGFDGEVYAFYLLKKYQGKGTGKKLMGRLINQLKSSGFTGLYLWVLKENGTTNIYKSLGGEETGVSQFEDYGGAKLEEVLYGWSQL